MATFTLVVHYLLSEVAAREPAFKGFTAAQVKNALLTTGYLRLEFVRARLPFPESLRGQPLPEAA